MKSIQSLDDLLQMQNPRVPWFLFTSVFSIFGYSTSSTATAAYIIGGCTPEGKRVTTIARYDDKGWTKAGDLRTKRSSHVSVMQQSKIMIIGGYCESNM